MTRETILMVKPDAMADVAKMRSIYAAIESSRLSIVREDDFVLTGDDIGDIWPKFGRPGHEFASLMLRAYLSGHDVRVIWVSVVDGDVSVLDEARRVRRHVREQHGTSMFANLVHTPADENERIGNVAFFRSLTSGELHVRHVDDSAGAGSFGRFAELSVEKLRTIVDGIWAKYSVALNWDWVKTHDVTSGNSILLLPGSDNSVDFEVSAIVELFPEERISWAIERFLEAELYGAACLPFASQGEREAAAARLGSWGIRYRLVDPVNADTVSSAQ